MKTSAGQLVRGAGNGNRETEGIGLCQNYSPLHYREEWTDMAPDKEEKHSVSCISSQATGLLTHLGK